MTLTEQFKDAQKRLASLNERPSNEEFLELYALFKQATAGDNTSKKPGMFDLKAQYKWKSWNAKKGMTQEEAREKYVAHVDTLLGKYKHK